MLEALKRNLALVAVLAAGLFLYFRTTKPALEEYRALAKRVDAETRVLDGLQGEAQRLDLYRRALEAGDATLLERLAFERFVTAAPPSREPR